jgi:hypothetical protein
MTKLTSALLTDIINYVVNNEDVRKILALRDNHATTWAQTLACRFYKRNASSPNLASYVVDFVYNTQNSQNEPNDDVSVFVEVDHGPATPEFRILQVRYY